MNKENITDIVLKILTEKFDIPSSVCIPDNFSQPLTGKIWKLSGIDLTFLFFEIEKTFKIKLEEDDLICYGFCTIEKIINIILKKINN